MRLDDEKGHSPVSTRLNDGLPKSKISVPNLKERLELQSTKEKNLYTPDPHSSLRVRNMESVETAMNGLSTKKLRNLAFQQRVNFSLNVLANLSSTFRLNLPKNLNR